MKHLAWKLFGAALILGVTIDILFYRVTALGINVLLAQVILLLTISVLIYKTKAEFTREMLIAGTFSLLFATTFAIWTSWIGLTLSGFGLFFSNLIVALALIGHHGTFHHPVHIVIDTIRYSAETFFTKFGFFSELKIPKVSPRNSAVLRGILLLLPLLFIFGTLFLSSDLVLQQQTEQIQNWINDFLSGYDIFGHIAIIFFVTLFFTLVFAAAFWKRINIDGLKQLVVRHNVESSIVLAGLNGLFLFFLAFQAFYLFGGSAAWDSIEGITYSEYAVNGFSELAAISTLVILLILTLRYFHTEKMQRKIIEILEGLLILQALLVVFSAWKRMALYVAQYDFTPARLFGFWFFITVSLLLILLGIHIALKKAPYTYLQHAPILLGVAMLIFTASAPDALAVKLNVNRAGIENVDIFPLFNELSVEAYPAMKRVLEDESHKSSIIYDASAFCGRVEPNYSAYANGQITYFLKADGEEINIWDESQQDQNELNRFITRMNWINTKSTVYDDEQETTVWVPEHDLRAWNFARTRVNKLENGTLDLNVNQEFVTIEDVAQACGFDLQQETDKIPISPPMR